MIDFEGCIKAWLNEDKVSEGMEALLLAIEDDCLLASAERCHDVTSVEGLHSALQVFDALVAQRETLSA